MLVSLRSITPSSLMGNFYAVLPSILNPPCRSVSFHVELDDILRLPCCTKQDAERITTQYLRLWSRFQGNHSILFFDAT